MGDGFVGLEESGGFVWAWGESQIWQYADGRWSRFSGNPWSEQIDVAFGLGTLWVMDPAGPPQRFVDGEWSVLAPDLSDESISSIATLNMIEAVGGVLWISSHDDLYRWDGEEITNVGHPLVGRIGETFDVSPGSAGSVWVTGYCLMQRPAGLSRYDPGSGTWEAIHPVGVDPSLIPELVSISPTSDLWVMFTESGQWAGTIDAVARLDGVTERWTLYRSGLPDTHPFVIEAGMTGVWMGQGPGRVEGVETPGVTYFDGVTWTTYVEDTVVADIALAPDGTVWYLSELGEVHQLDQDDPR